jgi:hypothetical protein
LQNCQEKIQGTGDGAGYAEYPNWPSTEYKWKTHHKL